MKKLLLILAVLSVSIAYSQSKNIKINGTVIAQDDDSPLESATVYLERIKDSSVINYTISDKKGIFTLEDKVYDESANLFISYIGYEVFKKTITFDKENIDIGTIKLSPKANTLDEVVIKSRAPITVKKDTLEFNAKAFDTKADAKVEDLLKKLPGVVVSEDGKISVNGKEVNKILVNGKPFFKDDPTIATRNLSKDIIEKVQVTDTKSKTEAFLGEEGSKTNKTINLVIKEENNKGAFGEIAAGAGSRERYEVSGMLNLFDNDQRLSIVAGGNNANSHRFSFGGISSMYGGTIQSVTVMGDGSMFVNGSPFFMGGRGITTSRNAGVDYSNELSEKVDLSTDYFFSTTSTENESKVNRENILPDSRYFSENISASVSENDNHKINLDTQIKLDSTLMIDFRPSFTYNTSMNESESSQSTRNEQQELTNESESSNFTENTSKTFNNRLSVSKKLNTKGSHLRISLSNRNTTSEGNTFLDSYTEVFGTNPSIIERNQRIDTENTNNNTDISLRYKMAIKAKELFFNTNFSHGKSIQENVKSSYNFDDLTNDFTDFDTDLSTDFSYTTITTKAGASVNLRKEKISAEIGSNLNFRTLENEDGLRPEYNLKRNFTTSSIRSYFRYKLSKSSNLNLNYNLNNTPPPLSRLQPFKDVSNPLNTIIGNPNLVPSRRQSVSLSYYTSNMQKKTNFNMHMSTNFSDKNIIAKTIIDENFVRTTTYDNVDGNKSIYGNIGYGKRYKLDSTKTIRYNISFGANTNRSVNFSNGVKYFSNNQSLTPRLGVTFNWQDVMEISPNYSLSFSKSKYDIDEFEDRNFSRHSFSLRTRTSVPKNLEWSNRINYNYNPNIADGFKKSSWNWNTTLQYKFPNNKAFATLKVFDLLNQNTNAKRISTQNYIQDSESTILRRYFMLSFKWKFNSTGKVSQGRSMPRGGYNIMF